MGCNCKRDNITDLAFDTKGNNVSKYWYVYVMEYTVKILAFLITLVIGLPVLNGYVIYLLFKFLILNRNLNTNDLVSSLVSLSKKFLPKDEDDDDDYYNEEDEYTLTDVDEIEELTIFEKK